MYFIGKYSFEGLGENYKDSYIVLKYFNKTESIFYAKKLTELEKDHKEEDIINTAYEVIQDKFVEGKLFNPDTKNIESMTKEDVLNIPPVVLGELVLFVRGMLKKN